MLAPLATYLVLSGCSFYPSDPSPWHADETFTPLERRIIVESHDYLERNIGVGGESHRTIVFDLSHPADGVTPDVPWTVIRRTSPADRAANPDSLYDISRGRLELNVTADDDMFGEIVAHEWGHMMRLTHHDDPGVMSPDPPIGTWTAADASSCRADGVCYARP